MSGRPRLSGAVPSSRARMAWFLAAVAGTVDAAGYLALLHVFVANMSGNSVKLGTYLARGAWGQAARSGLPVGVFVTGVGLGVFVGEMVSHRSGRLRLPVLLLTEATVLLGAAALGSATSPSAVQRGFTAAYAGVTTLLVTAMSLQTAALQRVGGRTVRTTYVTGMLTGLATGVALSAARRLRRGGTEREDGGGRARLMAGVWTSYLAGAVVGAAGEGAWRYWWLLAPITALMLAAGVTASTVKRNEDA